LPDVGGIACRCGDVDSKIGIAGADQVYAVSGSEQDLAIGCGDDAGVLDIRGDQEDLTAFLRRDVSLVNDPHPRPLSRLRERGGEIVASGKEVGIAELEG